MRKLHVEAPHDSRLVYLAQDINCASGSVAINDAFHDMFISINGELVGPLREGRYTLDPRFSPFFTRLRTYMTGGVAPINVSIFYVSTRNFTQGWGTGEIVCSEKVLNVPVPIRLAAGGTLIFKVTDSRLFLTSLVGLRGFDSSEAMLSGNPLTLPLVRNAVISRMSGDDFMTAQQNLTQLSSDIRTSITPAFSRYGIAVSEFVIGCLNINEDDLNRLREMHAKRVDKSTDIEALSNEINTIYHGDPMERARTEAMINLSRNPGAGGMSQLAMVPALFQMGRELATEMEPHLTTGGRRTPHPAEITCASCGEHFSPTYNFCPYCGHRHN